jgi:nicotinamide mononucleotide adenylyltransferase
MKHIGAIHGRFQPFHLDHMNYIISGLKMVDFMYIGITNPDPTLTKTDSTDTNRSLSSSNPCTYYERLLMAQGALFDYGYKPDQFCIVPFPINIPDLWQYYVPPKATYFVSIYDEWGEKKLSLFQSNGLKTDILYRKSLEDKGICGSEVRLRIAQNNNWEELLPQSTIQVIKEFNIQERIRNAFQLSKSDD